MNVDRWKLGERDLSDVPVVMYPYEFAPVGGRSAGL